MSNALSLKQWSEGATPEKDDFLSWSNLIFQRSLQVENPQADAVSEYLFGQWSASVKDPDLVVNTFERTFSGYSLRFQIDVLDMLDKEGVAKPIDFLDKVKSNGLMQRYLLTLPEVWSSMQPHQLRDKLYTWLREIVQFGKDEPGKIHPSWQAIDTFKTATDRRKIFNSILGPKILDLFGLFRDDRTYFNVETFHNTVEKLGHCWGVTPAQIVYGLMLVDYDQHRRDYDRFAEFLEPYANDIRELIQFSPDPQAKRMSENLPESSRPVTMDMVFAFALAMDPANVFMDRNQIPEDVHDPEAAQALSSAF